MKKNALYVQGEASKKFNPYTLKNYLMHIEDGYAIVDRSRVVKSEEDERLFYVIINEDYAWDYSDPGDATIYYEVRDGKIYGGVYQEGVGRITRKLIAVERSDATNYAYLVRSYQVEVYNEIVRNING